MVRQVARAELLLVVGVVLLVEVLLALLAARRPGGRGLLVLALRAGVCVAKVGVFCGADAPRAEEDGAARAGFAARGLADAHADQLVPALGVLVVLALAHGVSVMLVRVLFRLFMGKGLKYRPWPLGSRLVVCLLTCFDASPARLFWIQVQGLSWRCLLKDRVWCGRNGLRQVSETAERARQRVFKRCRLLCLQRHCFRHGRLWRRVVLSAPDKGAKTTRLGCRASKRILCRV